MLLPEIVALAPLAGDRVNEEIARAIDSRMQERLTMPDRSLARSRSTGRLRGLRDALRFARIPLFVSLIVAFANTEPRPRLLALALGVLAVLVGLGLEARRILFGDARPDRRHVTGEFRSAGT